MSSYKLRPHHGMCIQFFRGQGYGQAFVENMTMITETLRENPMIQLCSGADDLCATCPNRVGEVDCRSDAKVRGYDQAVLALCRLSAEEVLPWAEFSRRVQSEIFQTGLRETICGECQWTRLCK